MTVYVNLIFTMLIIIGQSIFLSWLFFHKTIPIRVKVFLGFSPLITFFSAIIITSYYFLTVFGGVATTEPVRNILQLGLLLLLFSVMSSILTTVEYVKILSNFFISEGGSN